MSPSDRQADEGRPDLSHLFALGRKMHTAGGLAVAERAYRQVLAADPGHPEALRYLGILAHQTGHGAEALELIRQAAERAPGDAGTVADLSWVCLEQGKIKEAVAFGREAVALDPALDSARLRFADALRRDSQWKEAEAEYNALLDKTPRDKAALIGVTFCRLAEGDTEKALAYIGILEEIDPDQVDVQYLKGISLRGQGTTHEALPALSRAFQLAPTCARMAIDLAMSLDACGQLEAAETTLRYAEPQNPNDAELLSALSHILINRQRYEEAEVFARRGIAIAPDMPSLNNNLGRICENLWRIDEAIGYFRRAADLCPDAAIELTNFAMALGLRGEMEESNRLAERAFELMPDHLGVHFNLAIGLLRCGDLARGWEIYELSRYTGPRAVLHAIDLPILEVDEDPAGMTILVRREQGIGDSILFLSVLPEIIARAKHCIVECMPKIVTLLKRSFPGTTVLSVFELHAMGNDVPADRQILAGSLCRRYRTSWDMFPNPHTFLVPDPERVEAYRRRLEALLGRVKIVFLWRGRLRTDTPKNSFNYLTLDQLAPVLRLPDIAFVSAQYDADGKDARQEIAEAREKYGVEIHEFEDLDAFEHLDDVAALLAACDVVIGPPTATLHIAGALGKPTLRWAGAPDHFNLAQPYCPLTPSVRNLIPEPLYDKAEIVRLLLERLPAFIAEHTGAAPAPIPLPATE
ncbi:MAG: tetratricopeptide repeat protein [Alphaproteobacteria bacterium]|nr:tetratricopeptide repeat protein [Alphaproteobacteria bacterium]